MILETLLGSACVCIYYLVVKNKRDRKEAEEELDFMSRLAKSHRECNFKIVEKCNKLNKENLDLKEQLLREEQATDKVVQDLEQKLNETRDQLKLEDEASCKIIKDLEDEIEKERALNQTYSGYIKYILNAPRAVRRRFVNGECIDWYDENGVLRMKIKEEK
ncbi:MAG: hypothetical protein RSB50_06230 [Cetobacterium sp.]